MRAFLSLLFVAVCGSLSAAVLWLISWTSGKSELPTCISYTITLQGSQVKPLEAELLRKLSERGISPIVGEGFVGWEANGSRATLHSSMSLAEAVGSVCADKTTSVEWQAFSQELEPVLARYGKLKSAHVQFNPEFFACAGQDCFRDVSVPVDFRALTNGVTGPRLKK